MRGILSLTLLGLVSAPGWAQEDDHGDFADEATQLAVGESVEGEIEWGDDEDWFAFDAEAGVAYDLRTTLTDLEDSVLHLVAADGETDIEENDDAEGTLASRIGWTCPEAGRYYLVVRGYDADQTGKYTVIAQRAQEHIATAGPRLVEGVAAQGEITEAGGTVSYTFAAEEGETYRFQTAAGTLTDTILGLYESDGSTLIEEVDDVDSDLAASISWTCPETDTYVLEVSGYGDGTGQFTITPIRLGDEPLVTTPEEPADAEALAVGEARAGEIDASGPDWYTFAAESGHAYIVRVVRGSLSDSVVGLFGADGETLIEEIDDIHDQLDSEVEWACEEAGEYFVRVRHYSEDGTGSYAVQVRDMDADQPMLLFPGLTEEARIDGGDDEDEYYVFEAAGEEYTVTPDGTTVEARVEEIEGLTWTAESDTLRRVTVRPSEGQVGAYTVRMDRGGAAEPPSPDPEPEPEPDPPAVITVIPAGATLRGRLDASGERDWFSFEARPGATYVLHVHLDGLDDSVLSLMATDQRSRIQMDDDGGIGRGSRIVWTCGEAGTYHLVVRGFSADQMGGYRIEVEEMTDDFGNAREAAASLERGESVDGTIDYRGDEDWFRIDCEEGVTYSFIVELGSLIDSVLILENENGRTLVRSDDENEGTLASLISWTCPESGTYYLRAAGYATARGSYRLRAAVEF